MKYFLVPILLIAGAQQLFAQDWARERVDKSPRHHEWTTVTHDKRSVETFVVNPASQDKVPVVLLVHGSSGMTDWMQDMADQFAQGGYIAVAPDLLSGMGPNGGRTSAFSSQDQAEAAAAKLDADQVTADLNAVADYALKLSQSNGKLFVVGFDWGGDQAFRFAATRPDLAATLVFDGLPPDKGMIAHISAPVYGFYARKDAQVIAAVPDLTSSMQAAGKTFGPVLYEGADHGFMQLGEAPNAEEPNAIARHEANERMMIILKKINQTGHF